MTDDAHRAILRQILGDDRVEMPRASSGGDAADGRLALRLETARAVRDDFGLTAVVETCNAIRPKLDELQSEVTPERLSILLEGGEGRVGLLVFSPELALALLEWRLLGMLAAEAPETRALTGTDAAILADLVDPWLARFGKAMSGRPGGDWAMGYTQAKPVEDARHVPLLLEDAGYHGFRLTLSLGRDGRGGELMLALPESHAPAPVKPSEDTALPWPEALRAGVLGAELTLNGVLWRTRLAAAALGRLQPGDLIPIPAMALSDVRLEGPGRVAVARGRLGQSNGERAVRIEGTDATAPGLAAFGDEDGALSLGGAAAAALPGAAPEAMGFPAAMPGDGDDFPGAMDEAEFPSALAGDGEADFPAADFPDAGFPAADFPAMGDLPGEEDEDFPGGFPAMAQPLE